MKITIDTQHDSKEDILKAIELLRNLSGNVKTNTATNIFDNNTSSSEPSNMMNMFGNNSSTSSSENNSSVMDIFNSTPKVESPSNSTDAITNVFSGVNEDPKEEKVEEQAPGLIFLD